MIQAEEEATAEQAGQDSSMKTMQADPTQLWLCEPCGFVYDPAEGDPDGGIPPGTTFADLPDSWYCPVCGARKSDFVPV